MAAAIAQIIQVFTLRADWLLSGLEVKDSSQGSVLSEDCLAGWLRQSMTVDLSDLKEEGFALEPAPRQWRSPGSTSGESVAGVVDKGVLLEAFDTEIALVEAQAEVEAVSAAHSDDVSAWAGAIAQWLREHSSNGSVCLLELQQGVEMPLMEVWLGLLLAKEESCQFMQLGEDFYAPQGVSFVTLIPKVKLIELEELRTR